MSDNSCLLMLDSAGGNVFYRMTHVLLETRNKSILRRSDHKEYSLDQKTIKDFSDLLKYNHNSKYHPSLPTGKGKVSSCLWIKNAIQTSENMQRNENPESENKQPKKIKKMKMKVEKPKPESLSKEVSISGESSENPCLSDLQSKENPVSENKQPKKIKSKKMKMKVVKSKPESLSKEVSISGESSENPCLSNLLQSKENPESENKQPKKKKIKSKKMKMKVEKPKPGSLSKEVSISGESSENPCLSDLQSKENPESKNKQPKEKKIKSPKNEEESEKTETC